MKPRYAKAIRTGIMLRRLQGQQKSAPFNARLWIAYIEFLTAYGRYGRYERRGGHLAKLASRGYHHWSARGKA